MYYIIGFISIFVIPLFKGLFSFIFSKDMALFLLRLANILAVLALLVAYVVIVGTVLDNFFTIFLQFLSEFNDFTNNTGSGSNSSLSCLFYYIHLLGLDVALTSFLSGLFSLGIMYFTFRFTSLGFVIITKTKSIVFKALK